MPRRDVEKSANINAERAGAGVIGALDSQRLFPAPPAPETAAGPWQKIAKGSKPVAGRSYLIFGNYGGLQVADVAFFKGFEPDGTPRWILSDVDIDQRCIVRFAEIFEPEELA